MTDSAMRTVIVTGGTGALGREVVSAFLDAGDRVVVPWIVEAEAKDMPPHERVRLVEADVSEPAGAAAVVSACDGVDVLVNGAGGFAGGTAVHETDVEVWDRLYRLNVRTAVCMCAAAVPAMTRGGTIINVASQAATDCPAGIAAYSASKAGIVVLTRSLQNEVAASGIRVNAVVPTTIDTPANRQAMPDADFASWTPPAKIAGVMRWLASEAGSTVRGGLIPV